MKKVLLLLFVILCSIPVAWSAEDGDDYTFAVITYSSPRDFSINAEHFKASSKNEAKMKAVYIMYAYIGAYNAMADNNIFFADGKLKNPLPFDVRLIDASGHMVEMFPRHSFENMAKETSNSAFGYEFRSNIDEIREKFIDKKSKTEKVDLYNEWPFPKF